MKVPDDDLSSRDKRVIRALLLDDGDEEFASVPEMVASMMRGMIDETNHDNKILRKKIKEATTAIDQLCETKIPPSSPDVAINTMFSKLYEISMRLKDHDD